MSEPFEADDSTEDVIVLSWWQNPVNLVTMLVTMALLAGMAGWLIGHNSNDVKSSAVDVGYLQDMRVHHEQAVEMSFTFLERPATSSGLRTVARSIVFGQAIEIGVMIQLLRDMDAPTESDEGTAMAWMGMAMNDEDMPGMASEAEITALGAAKGADADELFTQLMIDHHRGGIDMSNEAAERAANPDVERYASAWAAAQRDEILELEKLRA